MTTQHLINRINWLKRQKVDPWEVVGENDHFSYTMIQIEEHNEELDEEVEKLKNELEARKAKVKH